MIQSIAFDPVLSRASGLHGGTLADLGKLVVLVGPNGAGKTRFLNLLEEELNQLGVALEQDLGWVRKHVRWMKDQLKAGENPNTNRSILGLLKVYSVDDADQPLRAKLLPEGEELLQAQIHELEALLSAVERIRLSHQPVDAASIPPVVRLTSHAQVHIEDATDRTPAEVQRVVHSMGHLSFESLTAQIHVFLHHLSKLDFDRQNPMLPRQQKSEFTQELNGFNALLQELLGTTLTTHYDAEQSTVVPCLFGRPFSPNELSHGQKLLLTWTIAFHQQRDRLTGAILLLDAPELHLSPDAMLKVIQHLQHRIIGPHGQIWVTTHSLPLVAYAGVSNVYYVHQGSIEAVGIHLRDRLTELCGGPEGRRWLKTFLADSSPQ